MPEFHVLLILVFIANGGGLLRPAALPHWGGGFGFYELMPEIRMRTANCFYDSAASHLLYDGRVYSLMTQLARGRVFFGSDFPLTSQAKMLRRVIRAGLPDVDLHQFLAGNAIAAGLH